MFLLKIIQSHFKITANITLLLAIAANNQPIKWLPNSHLAIFPVTLTAQNQPTTSGGGRPPTRVPGGKRGGCQDKKPGLFDLTHTDNSDNMKNGREPEPGLTLKTHPTILVYVPYTPYEAPSGELSVQDENENNIYRVPFTLPATPGVVSITIPSTAPPLEINKKYEWYFYLNCRPPSEESKEISPGFVRGWVQRIPLSGQMERELNVAKTPQKRIEFYARNNIWYERLFELSIINPKNTTPNSDWIELLKSLGLEDIAQQPIVGSVKTNSPAEEKLTSNKDFYKKD